MDSVIEQIILQMPTVGVLVYLVYRLQQLNEKMTTILLNLLDEEDRHMIR